MRAAAVAEPDEQPALSVECQRTAIVLSAQPVDLDQNALGSEINRLGARREREFRQPLGVVPPLRRAGAQRRGVERIDAAVHGERGMKRETEQAALLEPFVERRHAPGQIQQRAADGAVAAHLPNKAVLLV